MSAISSHTFSQTFRKFVDDFRDHFYRNLDPCLFQASLQRFDQDMRLRACLGLQDAQNEEVHKIELRRVQCHSSRTEIERKTRKETNADCFANCVFARYRTTSHRWKKIMRWRPAAKRQSNFLYWATFLVFISSIRKCTSTPFQDFRPISLRIFLTDQLEIPTSLPNFLVKFFRLLEFLAIRLRIFCRLAAVLAVFGRPERGRSSLDPVSWYRLFALRKVLRCMSRRRSISVAPLPFSFSFMIAERRLDL